MSHFTVIDNLDGAVCYDHPLCPWCLIPNTLRDRVKDETFGCACEMVFTVFKIITPLGTAFLSLKVCEREPRYRVNGKGHRS